MLGIQEPAAGLGDMVGSRKLIALGAVLGWLVVVHLLVNIWLLCILSGLLALLGGWLGSQAVIRSSSRVHLERFLLLEGCPPSAEAESQLDAEIDSMIQKIVRDFVSSWYRAVSSERGFEGEVQRAMKGLAAELKRRLAQVDKQLLTQKVLLLSGCHLQTYKKARESVAAGGSPGDAARRAERLWQAYCGLWAPHLAVQSPANEADYARRIVDLLLRTLVPQPHLETRTGRFVVVELVTCNVLLPMINKMADPDWLNLLLVGIFSKTGSKVSGGKEKGKALPPVPAPSSCPPVAPDSLPLPFPPEAASEGRARSPRGSEPSVGETLLDGLECPLLEGKEPVSRELSADMDGRRASTLSVACLQTETLGSFFPCEDLEMESPMSDIGKDSGCVALPEEFLADSLAALEGSDGLEQEDGVGVQTRYSEEEISDSRLRALSPCPGIQIEPAAEKDETLASLAALLEASGKSFLRRPSCLEKELGPSESLAHSPQDLVQLPSLLSSSPTAPMGTFSFEPLSSPDGPVVIQNLRITGTITAREHSGTGFHPYTLYTVKYETTLDSENTSSIQQVAYHTVNRRYREFLNLQTRLEEKGDLRKFIKNIKGPKKIFPDLPFGNMDTDKVEARKSLLESFLKQLCAIPEIANSEEMQEFLALNTDARIAFVKKPFVVSRIDKVVMNAIVDTLKTAFPRSEPQSPTEELSEAEVDGKLQSDGKKPNKSRLRFPSSKIAPVLNVAAAQEKVVYSLREGTTVSEFLSLAGMESFIQKQEKLLETVLKEGPEGKGDGEFFGHSADLDVSLSEVSHQPPAGSCSSGSESLLADTALDLLRLVMVDHWSWLCAENMQKVLHMLFGTLIQRWLEVQVDNLTCTQRWVQYLRLLQESIWPGGVLPVVPKPLRTEEQKVAAEKQALQSLMGILPELILEILGTNKCQQSWSLVLESMQHPIINRHMVYCLADILLEFLIPGSQTDKPKMTSAAASACGMAETRAGPSSH
ncbi:sorting nexin-19 isoform X2 [Hemicordylus capensis]|uniref:sorting nexin-19 isoform X2 n=1 Tax=Hemicordylus capensis TaxID=884348 RepID=UPI002303573F|nr:sorting nexin-19 isoform X2 [Hemicordylus capensis]